MIIASEPLFPIAIVVGYFIAVAIIIVVAIRHDNKRIKKEIDELNRYLYNKRDER